MTTFEPVDPKVRFPELEEAILAWWAETDVFRRSLELREGSPSWIFYEGPPTANGKPGIHHVEPRTFKDVYPRFKTMTGHRVPRKGGWDCHGLPVEIEVEKEIGTTGKKDIEAFGVAEFNQLCRESVLRYVGEFERLTRRIGFWIDMSDAYRTMDTEYIESVWWSLKELHRRGLLAEDHKVTAYCPRCGTALSDAEVALGYAQTVDPSVFVRLPIVEAPDPSLVGASLVIWTTTPWTLPSNTGVAVDPDAEYDEVEIDGERLVLGAVAPARPCWVRTAWSARPVAAMHWSARATTRRTRTSRARTRWSSATSSPSKTAPGSSTWRRRSGRSDLEVGRANGWPVWRPVGDDGRFIGPRAPVRPRPVREGRGSADHRGPPHARHPREGRRPTNTPTRSAGGAQRRSSTTRVRPGTCGPRP